MMTERTGSRNLESWLTAIEADVGQPGLCSLAAGIRSDQQAVANGLTLPYSSGKVDGTVNKIKMIKRQMYGRAGFDLLRKRVILHPALPRSQNSRQSLTVLVRRTADLPLSGQDPLRVGMPDKPGAVAHEIDFAYLVIMIIRNCSRIRGSYMRCGLGYPWRHIVPESGDPVRGGRCRNRPLPAPASSVGAFLRREFRPGQHGAGPRHGGQR
jgi:hypothetical protein